MLKHGSVIGPTMLKAMSGLEGKAMFERVESSFTFNRCLGPGSVEAHRLLPNNGCADIGFRGREVEIERHGAVVGLQRKEGASDLQMGGQLMDYAPLQHKFGTCSATRLKRRSGLWFLNLQVCGGQARMMRKKDLRCDVQIPF